MGAWGTGVFSDDVACDVRDTYRALLMEGHQDSSATDFVLETYREVLQDEDSAAVVWLSLAVTQWRAGRLEDRVKDEALRVIEEEVGLGPWRESRSLLRARRRALAKAASLLRSPQRPRSTLRKRQKYVCDWVPGDVFRFQLRSGRYILLRVAALWSDAGGTYPIVNVLDWCGDAIPQTDALLALGIRGVMDPAVSRLDMRRFMIGETSVRRVPLTRLQKLDCNLLPDEQIGVQLTWFWRNIDEELEKAFGYC